MASSTFPDLLESTSYASEKLSGALTKLRESSKENYTSFISGNRKLESWKYTNLNALLDREYAVRKSDSGDDFVGEALSNLPEQLKENICVFVDGLYSAQHSSYKASNLSPLSELKGELPKSMTKHLSLRDEQVKGDPQLYSAQPLRSLNGAFLDQGIAIEAAKGEEIEGSVVFLYLNTSSDKSFLPARNFISAGARSKLSVVELYMSAENAAGFSNVITDIVLEDEAEVSHTRVFALGSEEQFCGTVEASLHEKSNLKTFSLCSTGKLIRNEVRPHLYGEFSDASLDGITLLNGSQHADNHIEVEHVAPNCTSSERFTGVYSGKARGVFGGTIIVQPEAQKTDAFQSNKSLLLSDTAHSDSRPCLKIWADDVKCSHGATVGQVDENALFYLRSRGISKKDAWKMLVQAFASESLKELADENVREFVDSLMIQRLEELI